MIYTTSDLHYGAQEHTSYEVILLAQKLNKISTKDDVLLLTGDMGTNDKTLNTCLKLFKDFKGPKLAVLGNHDIWVMPNESRSSYNRYSYALNIVEQNGFHALDRGPFIHNNIGFAGKMGWYDYSFIDTSLKYDISCYMNKTFPTSQMIWADVDYVKLPFSDINFASMQADSLRQDLDSLVKNTVERIVVAMHHVPHADILPGPLWLLPKKYRFMRAYLGSGLYGKLISQYEKVKLIVNGHIHHPAEKMICGKKYVSMGGDYEKKLYRGHV